jgi:hypothetical protein
MQTIYMRARALAFTYTDVMGLERGIVQLELPATFFRVGLAGLCAVTKLRCSPIATLELV